MLQAFHGLNAIAFVNMYKNAQWDSSPERTAWWDLPLDLAQEFSSLNILLNDIAIICKPGYSYLGIQWHIFPKYNNYNYSLLALGYV